MEDKGKDVKIDLSSTVLEKSVDVAKGFVDKLVSPSIEELGLLVRDQISLWRFGNQVKILNKAKALCEKHGVKVKSISPKLLCPYLENASLEDDDELQDKWAALLSNMVDSRQNVQSHVFPYILSQLSKDEFILLEAVVRERDAQVERRREELQTFLLSKAAKEAQLTDELATVKAKLEVHRQDKGSGYHPDRVDMNMELHKIQAALGMLGSTERSLKWRISAVQPAISGNVNDFEVANIIRLGLAREVYEASARPQKIQIPFSEYGSTETVDLEIEVETETTILLTELGELFLASCKVRADSNPSVPSTNPTS